MAFGPKKKTLRVVSAADTKRGAVNAGDDALREESPGTSDDACTTCSGSGMILKDGIARRCECWKRNESERILRAACIPARYLNCSLGNFEAESDDSKWRAKAEAGTLIEDFPDLAKSNGKGLMYVGNVGVGKTHLAVAILRELIERYGVRGLFYQFGMLLKEIQNSYNPVSQTSELKVLEPVLTADVLVLDELGASKPTDWVRDTVMQIINTRYNEKRVTIFTTNFRDVAENEKTETLEDRIGTRVRSRLYEMCKTVQIEGEDYRKRLSESGPMTR